jgi:hypothetical protein
MRNIGVIGASGMVGQNIVKQFSTDSCVFSITRENINEYVGFDFDLIFIAAADGRKYHVNNEPYSDLISIMNMVNIVRFYKSSKFVLISTVDVYNFVGNVGDESTILSFMYPSYGSNRLLLELALKNMFQEKLLIVRLQGLVADNLKKNLLFDIKSNRKIQNFSPDSTFQFYPLNRFRGDLEILINSNSALCNISAEPLLVEEIYSITSNNLNIDSEETLFKVNYDVTSNNQTLSQSSNGYWVNKEEISKEIQLYLKSQ